MHHALDDFSHDGANHGEVGSLGLINVEEAAIGGGHADEVEVHARRQLSTQSGETRVVGIDALGVKGRVHDEARIELKIRARVLVAPPLRLVREELDGDDGVGLEVDGDRDDGGG